MTAIAVRLCLYVAGIGTPVAARAIVNTRRLCEAHVAGRYELNIVDLRREPAAASDANLVAAPTLVRTQPLPERRFIGDMSRSEPIVAALVRA